VLQEEVWFERGFADIPAQSIRRMLTTAQVPGTDPRALFVGTKVYEAAGGVVRRDLFDSEDEGYFTDSQLLDRLVLEKLNAATHFVRDEGWQWVEVHTHAPVGLLAQYRRADIMEVALGEEDAGRLSSLGERYDELVAAIADGDESGLAEIDRLADEIAALEEKQLVWSDDEKTRAGVIVTVDRDGQIEVIRGLLKMNAADAKGGVDQKKTAKKNGHANGYAESVLVDLSAHRTAALRELLTREPQVASLALLHALVNRLFYAGSSSTCLCIGATEVPLDRASQPVGDGKAMQAWLLRHRSWQERIPELDRLWDWLRNLQESEQTELLAHCVSMTVDALNGHVTPEREKAISCLAGALGLEMSQWWRPTRENFLGRVTKTGILAAVSEGVSQQASWRIAGLKKERMVKEAEKLLADTAWVPIPLRTAVLPSQGGQA
jgi:ParB family transcriptional regulator, chromosome partitioning protein